MTYLFLYFLLWNITIQSRNSESQIAIQFHNLCVVVTNKLIFFTFCKPLIHSHSLYKLLELHNVKTDATTDNSCWANIVGSCCIRVGSGMQTDATIFPMVGATVHRGKDTAHKTFNLETMCNSCGPSFWPQQCWKSCADRFDHQPLLARAPSPDRIERTVQTDPTVRQTQTVD